MKKPTDEHPLPANQEAERCVLGSALIDNRKIPEILEGLEGTSSPFYFWFHQDIWNAIVALYTKGRSADIVTVIDALRHLPASEIASLTDGIPDIANVASYTAIVRDNACARDTIRALEEGMWRAFKREKPDTARLIELVGRWEDAASSEECYSAEQLAKVAAHDFDNFRYEDVTIKTGFPVFDAYTMGFQRGTLAIVAARPGAGKTALALNIAWHVARHEGRRVVFFSLEMPTRLMHDRLISSISGVPLRAIKNRSLTQDELSCYLKALGSLRDMGDRLVLDMASYELNSIMGRAFGEHTKAKIDLVVIDFAQKIINSSGPEQRHLNLEHTAYSLVNMAKKMDACVLLLSQLNRGSFDEPDLKQLAESSGLERAPRMAAILSSSAKGNHPACVRELHILKNSEGETGSLLLHFNGPTMTFTDGACGPGCINWRNAILEHKDEENEE